MKKTHFIFALLLCMCCVLFAFVGCGETPGGNGGGTDTEQTGGNSGNTQQPGEPDTPVSPGDTQILVVYFSCTGNTQAVAEKVAEVSGGTSYRIEPVEPYTAADLDWTDSQSRSQVEQRDPDARPVIANSVENMQNYDVVFLGYPIWNGQAPKIIYTFTDAYDLSGKTIVPFCTSGGSGISTSVNEIRQLEPDATVLDGRRFSASTSEADISDWIETLNIKSEGTTKMQISIRDARYELLYELNDSTAAKELLAQLPLTVDVEPFSNNEMTFYPPKKLSTTNTPLSGGEIGSLSYYAPWDDVVMFYAPCSPNGSLYEIGKIVAGTENISKLTGMITISAVE